MSYLESLFSLEGKTAVVIGGTGVLCGEMAQAMAMAGAEVVLVGRNLEKANERLDSIRAKGGNGYFVAADVSSREGIEGLLSEVLETSAKCDILVNGAGVNAATPFLDIPEDEYDRIFKINTKSIVGQLINHTFGVFHLFFRNGQDSHLYRCQPYRKSPGIMLN